MLPNENLSALGQKLLTMMKLEALQKLPETVEFA